MSIEDSKNTSDKFEAKTDALFFDSIDSNQQSQKGVRKSSTGATVLRILGIASGIIGVGLFTSIFSGHIRLPQNNEVIYLERSEAIICTAVTLGLAFLFSFMARKIDASVIRESRERHSISMGGDVAAATVVKQLERQEVKHKILRIIHYIILGVIIGSVVFAIAVGEQSEFYEILTLMVAILLVIVYPPVLIAFLVVKRKLKKMKSTQIKTGGF